MMRPTYLIYPTFIFEGDELETKDNKNRVRQGGPWKGNKIKKLENETPESKNVGATPYARVAMADSVCTMILR